METPNLIESVQPCSGQYSFKKDLRLNAWFIVAAAVYLVVLKVLSWHHEWSSLTRALVNLIPLLPGALYVRDCIRFVRGMDELQRRVQTEAWLFAAIGTLLISATINTLSAQGLPLGKMNHGLSLGGTFSLTFLLWIVGTIIFNRRYQ